MEIRRKYSVLAVAAMTAAFTLSALGCSGQKQASKDISQVMMVVFSSGGVIQRKADQIKARVGTLVYQGDIIKTRDGIMDLQTRSGSAIRVGDNTTIQVTSLLSGNTELHMKHGDMLAKVRKSSKDEKFRITTPTAIAGVRGTTFSVKYRDTAKPPVVKVMEGKVALSPRIPALRKISAEVIEKSASLKKLAALEKKEVIIEKETSGTLDAVVNIQVLKANEVLKQKPENGSVEKEITKITEVIETKAKPVIIKAERVTTEELQDASTLVAVDTNTFDEVATEQTKKGKSALVVVPEAIVKKLEKLHTDTQRKNQELVLKKIQKQAETRKLTTKKDFIKQYNKFEIIKLRDGRQYKGAVIGQNDTEVLVHTQKGVKRIKKSMMYEQIF